MTRKAIGHCIAIVTAARDEALERSIQNRELNDEQSTRYWMARRIQCDELIADMIDLQDSYSEIQTRGIAYYGSAILLGLAIGQVLSWLFTLLIG